MFSAHPSKSEEIVSFLKAEVHLAIPNVVSYVSYRYGKMHYIMVMSAFAQAQNVGTLLLNQHPFRRRTVAQAL